MKLSTANEGNLQNKDTNILRFCPLSKKKNESILSCLWVSERNVEITREVDSIKKSLLF